ncbi:MAG: hypothetical protein ACYSU8_08395, partial [Planctomycetota bacterium]
MSQGHEVMVFAGPLRKKRVTHTVNVKQPYEVIRYGYPIRGFRPSGLERLLFLRAFLKSHKKKAFDVIHS